MDVELERVDEPMEFGSDVDDAYAYIAGMGSTRGMTADLDAATREAALESLRAALAAAHRDGAVRFGSSAWLITARRA